MHSIKDKWWHLSPIYKIKSYWNRLQYTRVTQAFWQSSRWQNNFHLLNNHWMNAVQEFSNTITLLNNHFSFLGKKHAKHTLIWTRKSLRCSLKAGISWFKLKSPVTNSLTWALTENISVSISRCKNPLQSIKELRHTYSCRWGNADLRRLATYSWINIWLFTGFPGFNGVLIFPSSTKLNMYARIDACIVKPEQIKVIHMKLLFRTGCITVFWRSKGLFSSTSFYFYILYIYILPAVCEVSVTTEKMCWRISQKYVW